MHYSIKVLIKTTRNKNTKKNESRAACSTNAAKVKVHMMSRKEKKVMPIFTILHIQMRVLYIK